MSIDTKVINAILVFIEYTSYIQSTQKLIIVTKITLFSTYILLCKIH